MAVYTLRAAECATPTAGADHIKLIICVQFIGVHYERKHLIEIQKMEWWPPIPQSSNIEFLVMASICVTFTIFAWIRRCFFKYSRTDTSMSLSKLNYFKKPQWLCCTNKSLRMKANPLLTCTRINSLSRICSKLVGLVGLYNGLLLILCYILMQSQQWRCIIVEYYRIEIFKLDCFFISHEHQRNVWYYFYRNIYASSLRVTISFKFL